jgi:hypothetical protein
MKNLLKIEIKTVSITIGAGILLLSLTIAAAHYTPAMSTPPVRIHIHQPSDHTSVDCPRSTPGGELVYPVSGTIEGKLPAGSSIYIFIQQEGGDQWWISGQPLQQQSVVNGTWEQKWTTFGSTNSPSTDYVISVVVSTGHYKSGQNFASIPSDVLASDTVRISRK